MIIEIVQTENGKIPGENPGFFYSFIFSFLSDILF